MQVTQATNTVVTQTLDMIYTNLIYQTFCLYVGWVISETGHQNCHNMAEQYPEFSAMLGVWKLCLREIKHYIHFENKISYLNSSSEAFFSKQCIYLDLLYCHSRLISMKGLV